MVNDEVVAMLVVHADDIKIAAKEITDSVVADLNKRFLTKHLGEVTWHMSSECKRDREKGTPEISDSAYSKCCRTFRNHKASPIPASPSLDLRLRTLRWTRVTAKWWGVYVDCESNEAGYRKRSAGGCKVFA